MTVTGGSCLSPRVLALPLLLPCPPPEATSCFGAAAWTPAAVGSHAAQTTLLSRGSTAPSYQGPEFPALPPSSRVPSLLSSLGPSLQRVRSRHPWHRALQGSSDVKVLRNVKGQLCHYPVPTPDMAAASWPCPSTDHGQNLREFSKTQSYHLLTGDKNIALPGGHM